MCWQLTKKGDRIFGPMIHPARTCRDCGEDSLTAVFPYDTIDADEEKDK